MTLPRSWKTSLLGGGGILTAFYTMVIAPLVDDNTLTNPDWNAFIPIAVGFFGMLFAKDYNVTGKDAPPSPDNATK